MKHIFLFLFILLTATGVGATSTTITSIAAVVNAEIITTYQLERTLRSLLAQQGFERAPSEAEMTEIRQEVLEQMISDLLLQQRSRELGLRVSEQEIDRAVEDVKSNNNLDLAGLEAALEAEGMTLESYREQIRDDILRYRLMAQEVDYRAQVTSAEVRRYFEENIDQFDTMPRLHVSRISFPLPTDRSSSAFADIQEQAEKSRQRLLAGDDFDDVLTAIGDQATGGIMGELVLTDLAPPLQQALADLSSGDVSAPTEFNQQLHLFIVTERRSGEELAFEQAKAGIEERLRREKTEERFIQWQEELRTNAYVDRRL